jgi:CRISPR-associated protein Csc2
MSWKDSKAKEVFSQHLLSEVPIAPQRNYVSMVVLREFESTAVLTTEGQMLDVEVVRSGHQHTELMSRVLLQKRKQVAVERRTGRAFNRQLGEDGCDFMGKMCGKCPDCLIYGFAATTDEGSQRSRLITDSGFSIRSYDVMQRAITLNAIRDTTQGGVSGSAFAEREHIRPQAYFPTLETAVDVTPSELVYILRNILATTRYGAESNRQGYVKNHLVALLFGGAELISNLSLTQSVYDRLALQNGGKLDEIPLDLQQVIAAMTDTLHELVEQSFLPVTIYTGDALQEILDSLRLTWRSEEGNSEWLQELKEDHQAYLSKRNPKSK